MADRALRLKVLLLAGAALGGCQRAPEAAAVATADTNASPPAAAAAAAAAAAGTSANASIETEAAANSVEAREVKASSDRPWRPVAREGYYRWEPRPGPRSAVPEQGPFRPGGAPPPPPPAPPPPPPPPR